MIGYVLFRRKDRLTFKKVSGGKNASWKQAGRKTENNNHQHVLKAVATQREAQSPLHLPALHCHSQSQGSGVIHCALCILLPSALLTTVIVFTLSGFSLGPVQSRNGVETLLAQVAPALVAGSRCGPSISVTISVYVGEWRGKCLHPEPTSVSSRISTFPILSAEPMTFTAESRSTYHNVNRSSGSLEGIL